MPFGILTICSLLFTLYSLFMVLASTSLISGIIKRLGCTWRFPSSFTPAKG
uniref:Respiratory burst oxidase A n=1 Tax=Rhizophora mucronata TaxID=61149 RepID=A0A2P2N412_RHIMU